jgi:hypothetical protein
VKKENLLKSLDLNLLLSNSSILNKLETSLLEFMPNTSYDFTPSEKSHGTKEHIKVTYKMNNYGHRSDDFVLLDQKIDNYLFVGCSTTFGEGLPIEYSWGYMCYEYLKKEYNYLGNFLNLSFPGAGIKKISENIMRYSEMFGSPSHIFILLPDYARYIRYDKDKNSFEPSMNFDYDTDSFEQNCDPYVLFYEYLSEYRKLSMFCQLKNIKLIAASWEDCVSELFTRIDNVDNFFYLDYQNDMNKFIQEKYEEIENIKDKKFLYMARDNRHPGIVNHKFVAENFINKFKELR